MSRSYRKPWITCGYGSKYKQYAKNQANRLIRRTKDVPDGKAYRRFYNPYNICDYKWLANVYYPHHDFYEEYPWQITSK